MLRLQGFRVTLKPHPGAPDKVHPVVNRGLEDVRDRPLVHLGGVDLACEAHGGAPVAHAVAFGRVPVPLGVRRAAPPGVDRPHCDGGDVGKGVVL
eukprot:7229346-Pyramimonas_sp.AAC.2